MRFLKDFVASVKNKVQHVLGTIQIMMLYLVVKGVTGIDLIEFVKDIYED